MSIAIQRHLTLYFAWRFNRKPSDFTRATRVRAPFSNQAWRGLADVFNAMSWMKQIGVRLTYADMDEPETLGELTDVIAAKAGRRAERLATVKLTARKLTLDDKDL